MLKLDDAWENFLEGNCDNVDSEEGSQMDEEQTNLYSTQNQISENITNITNKNTNHSDNKNKEGIIENSGTIRSNILLKIPKASPIYISTKTKICYLNRTFELLKTFWKIKVLDYHNPIEGVVKKQIKLNSSSQEELDSIKTFLDNENLIDQHIINSINKPEGRIKFKDVRKISIGVCKKDIMSYRCKKKSAFYNCFVIILRLLYAGVFREVHVKIFNTGKLEIPGIQKEDLLVDVLVLLKKILRQALEDDTIACKDDTHETVLINSNFNCGFYIDREKLFDILRFKYNINSCYDPCSYPGIQCEFYYDTKLKINTGVQAETIDGTIKKLSFMIFRTGSVLIVGKCEEDVLIKIYEFVKTLLEDEFVNVATSIIDKPIEKSVKSKTKIITIYNTKKETNHL